MIIFVVYEYTMMNYQEKDLSMGLFDDCGGSGPISEI